MSTLDEDIARIAALRGRKVEDVLTAAHRPRFPTRAEVERILDANPHQNHDMAFYDALPAKSREFIRAQDRMLNCMWWAHLLHETRNEDEIIKAVAYCLSAT